ncbi:MAG: DUF1778 domain-containing protein [Actinomycetota bacterium]
MAARSERLEARLSIQEREQIERAAKFEGSSLSKFIVEAAIERADHVIGEHTTTMVPGDYFDRLIEVLDRPEQAPALKRAAKKVARRRRIA